MKRNIINSIWNRLNRNGINANFEYLFELRGLIEKVVIEDSLTPTEYAELTTLINGLLKSGEVKQDDLANDLNTLLNDLETNSESALQEIESARGEHTVLGGRLNGIDSQLAQTPTKTELSHGLSTKVDKGGNEQVSWGMLDQEAKENISGDKVAIVGENSVNTTNLVDKSATSLKRTVLGEKGLLLKSNDSRIPNFNSETGILTIYPTSWVINRDYRHEIESEVNVKVIEGYVHNLLVFDISEGSFKFVATGNLNVRKESEIELMLISYTGVESKILFSTFEFTIDWKKEGLISQQPEFINIGKNKIYNHLEKIYVGTGTNVAVSEGNSESSSFLAYIEPGKTYTIKKYTGGNRFRIAALEKYPHKEALPLESLYFFDGDNSSENQVHTFINNYPAYYLVVFTNSDTEDFPLVQVEEGTTATDYEPVEFNFFNKRLNDFSVGKNKFDGAFTEGIYVGIAPSDVMLSSGKAMSAVVPLERGKSYTFKKYRGGDRLRIAIVDQYPDKDVLPLESFYHDVIDNPEDEYVFTFFNGYGKENINYLVIYTNSNDPVTPLIQVEEGGQSTLYEKYELKYLGKPLSLNVETDSSSRANNYYIYDDITGIYNSPDLPSVAAGEDFVLQSSTHTDIYDLYDGLVSENQSYISKGTIGDDTTGKPMNYYHFIPQTVDSDILIRRPKLILLSGLHGNEKMAVWGLLQFLKDMCENWKSDNILEFIRWNFELVVVPMCNPSGYDLWQRKNYNGVDLNRNFPLPNWREMEDPNDINYGGPAPASEVETQIIVDFLNNNTDADYLIDFHNFFQHDGYVMWMPVADIDHKRMGVNVMNTLSRKWKKQYSQFPQDETVLGFTNNTNIPTLKLYGDSIGIKSTTLESVHQVTYGTVTQRYDKVTTNCAVDWVGNYLAAIGKGIN